MAVTVPAFHNLFVFAESYVPRALNSALGAFGPKGNVHSDMLPWSYISEAGESANFFRLIFAVLR